MTNSVTVRHNMETAHRLPHLPGKCQSLHGHSWWAEIEVAGPLDERGMVVEYGQLKKCLRTWIDESLDHGTMLGKEDTLLRPLTSDGCKVFEFDPNLPLTRGMSWPTVENVAVLLARLTDALLREKLGAPAGVHCARVTVRETHVNAATWTAGT